MPNSSVLRFRGANAASRAATLLGCIAISLLILLAGVATWQARAEAARTASRSADDLCSALAIHAQQAIDSADSVARFVQRALEAKVFTDSADLAARFGSADEHRTLKLLQATSSAISRVTVVDASGQLINTSLTFPPPPVSLFDRESYVAMVDDRHEPHLSVPVRSRIDGRWTIYVSRKLQSRDGSFIGAVIVGLQPRHFEDFYETLRMDRAQPRTDVTAMTMLRSDRMILARAPFDEGALGAQMSAVGTYSAIPATSLAAPAGKKFEPWDAKPSAPDSVLLVYKSVPRYPLVVAVAIAEELYLREWRDQAFAMLSLTGAATLLLAATFITLVRVLRRRERYLQEVEGLRAAAEAASRAKTNFLATVSHEVRTPLNGILGTADLLARSSLNSDQQQWAETLLSSGRSLLATINDILDISKIEAEELALHEAPFSLRAMIRDVLTLFSPHASGKGLGLSMHVDSQVPLALVGDEHRIQQILGNLVSNAIKFTDAGKVEVYASWVPTAEGTHLLRLEVVDEGVGIPESARVKLFQPFAQADGSVSRRFGGTGLGLAISKRLTSMMGGTIDYASRARGGTRFWLDLPLQEHVGAVPFERPSLEASDWTFAHSGSMDRVANGDTPARDRSARGHILVVEDNAINAMVVEAQLGRLGCTCRVAADGEEALQRLASNETFHLVLMDCMLPGITGMEVAKRWREIEAAKGLPHLPIVALTANALATNVQETKEAGMDDFLTKPCTLDKLEVAVGRWIGAPSAGQPHE